MDNEQWNVWECPCGTGCKIPADEQRWHMGFAECVELGGTPEKYALYKCEDCGTETWSRVEEWDEEGNVVPLSLNPLFGEAN